MFTVNSHVQTMPEYDNHIYSVSEEAYRMKKIFAVILAFLCLLTLLSIPAFAADAEVEPYGTPGSGYDQKTFTANGVQYSAKFYLQFNSSNVAKSRCDTIAETTVVHNALTVQFETHYNGYQIVKSGARAYTLAQKIQAGTTTYSYDVTYWATGDYATGINYVGGSASVNGSTTLQATLGSRSAS